MYRKIIIILALSLLICGSAFAAPVIDLEAGQASLGYTYQRFDLKLEGGGASLDGGRANASNFHLQYAPSQKLTLGLEVTDGSKTWVQAPASLTLAATFTDIYAQYGLDERNSIRVMVGSRNYDSSLSATDGTTSVGASASTNKFFYGLAACAPLGDRLNLYATFKHNNVGDDSEVGLIYNIDKNIFAVVQYRVYEEDEGSGVTLKMNGLGFGVNWRF